LVRGAIQGHHDPLVKQTKEWSYIDIFITFKSILFFKGDDFKTKKKELTEKAILPSLDIDHYNILLLGAVGVGKSSFINTLSTVLTGQCTPIAQSRQASSSVTNKVFKLTLTKIHNKHARLSYFKR
jgi:predicted GTPase